MACFHLESRNRGYMDAIHTAGYQNHGVTTPWARMDKPDSSSPGIIEIEQID
jgi:hypothetical protein